jgi:paraquat-inducible protein A
MTDEPELRACHCCGLVQRVPALGGRDEARCGRCDTRLRVRPHPRSRSRAAALAAAGLVVYPLAIGLPIMRIERFGATHTTNIWSGVVSLLSGGEVLVGVVVFVCSVVAPVAKLGAMVVLSMPSSVLGRRHRAMTYRFVEWIGRWGMVDVLLVAVLVAAVKLGAWAEVAPGPGLVAFAGVVILSLLSSAVFDPHGIWEEER